MRSDYSNSNINCDVYRQGEVTFLEALFLQINTIWTN